MQCEFQKANGQRCGAYSMENLKFCFSHNSDVDEAKRKAVLKGGRHKKAQVSSEEIIISSISDISPLISKCITEIRQNKLPAKSANAVGYLLGIALEALKTSEIEKRIMEIENALKLREKEL